MNEYSVVMVFVSSILTLQLKYKIMYETLEYWKQYKQEKELQEKISKEFKLFDNSTKLVSEYDKEEFDEWMKELVNKNGTTNY